MAIIDHIKINGVLYDIATEKAAEDEDGNNIKSTYGSDIELAEGNLVLKSKGGDTLSTVEIPTAKTYTATKDSVNSASLGTATMVNGVTSWNAGTVTSVSVENGVLDITIGTAPTLSYDAVSVPNITVTPATVVTDITES